MKSVPLKSMPEKIILIDQHNVAKVGTKLAEALRLNFKVDHLLLRNHVATVKQVRQAFMSNPKKSLIIFLEPGDLACRSQSKPHGFLFPIIYGIRRPKTIPFGMFWCGSIYRINNYAVTAKLPFKHVKHLKLRRKMINNLSPLRMVATEDLSPIGNGATYVGQPYHFPSTIPDKNIEHKIIHVPTASKSTDYFKGTNEIRKGFKLLSNDINSEITIFKTPNQTILDKMEKSTMFVATMTSWDYGTGYTGIEAISKGCLVFTKKPKDINIHTEFINVNDPNDLFTKVRYYINNPEEYESKRKEQFKWASSFFSYKNISNNIYKEIKRIINNGWKR